MTTLQEIKNEEII